METIATENQNKSCIHPYLTRDWHTALFHHGMHKSYESSSMHEGKNSQVIP